MPLSSVQGMSRSEYDAAGAATGYGGIGGDLQTLGQTIAMQPYRAAQGQYMGAQTGHMQAETQKISKYNQDIQSIQSILAPPPEGAAPYTPEEITKRVQAASGLVATNPDIAAQWPKTVGAIFSLGMTHGMSQAPTAGQQAAQSNLAVMTGAQTYEGTPTGGVQLQNLRNLPGFAAASATRYSADRQLEGTLKTHPTLIGDASSGQPPTYGVAGQSTGMPAYEPTVASAIAGNMSKPVMVGDAASGAPPTYSTAGKATATGQTAYVPTVGDIFAANTSKPVNVVDPNNPMGTRIVPTGQAETQGFTPRMDQPSSVQATVNQAAVQNATPEQRQQMQTGATAGLSGRPPPAAQNADEIAKWRISAKTQLQAMLPTRIGANEPAPELMDAIISQMQFLYDYGPSRGNLGAAQAQAIYNVTGGSQGLEQRMRLAPDVITPGRSQIILADQSNMQWPTGMQVPTQFHAGVLAAAQRAITQDHKDPLLVAQRLQTMGVPTNALRGAQ